MMRKLFIIGLIVLLAACQKHSDIIDSQRNSLALNKLNGKWLVVNYWATWCVNCTKDMRDFEKFSNDYKDKVIVLGVSFDELSNEKINTIKKELNITYPMTSHFPIDQYGVENIENLPRTYVFSPDGKMQKTLYGPQTEQMLAKAVGFKTKGNEDAA